MSFFESGNVGYSRYVTTRMLFKAETAILLQFILCKGKQDLEKVCKAFVVSLKERVLELKTSWNCCYIEQNKNNSAQHFAYIFHDAVRQCFMRGEEAV